MYLCFWHTIVLFFKNKVKWRTRAHLPLRNRAIFEYWWKCVNKYRSFEKKGGKRMPRLFAHSVQFIKHIILSPHPRTSHTPAVRRRTMSLNSIGQRETEWVMPMTTTTRQQHHTMGTFAIVWTETSIIAMMIISCTEALQPQEFAIRNTEPNQRTTQNKKWHTIKI